MQDLPRRLKDLHNDLSRFQAETYPSWEQAGQVFNELLAASREARPKDHLIQAIKPVGEQVHSRAVDVVNAPLTDTNAGSMLLAVTQLVQSVSGGRSTAA
jgi:hypothetical protein